MTTTITYDDKSVRQFMIASIFWGIIGMLVGVIIATQLSWWQMNGKFVEWITFGALKAEGISFLTFGRLRPLHTNAVIFAFVGNMMFAGIYYSTQRLCKCRMASDLLSRIHFWGWQLIIVAAAVTLPIGLTRGKEYAELIWPINIAVVAHLGGLRRQLSLDACETKRAEPLRRALVLHLHHRHGGDALHRQPPLAAHLVRPFLSDLRRPAGRPRPVVVWPQRRRLLPDHADPRHHVLFPAEGRQPPGLFLPAVHHPLLVAGLHLHLGRPAPPAQYRPAALAANARHALLAHALGTLVGRHAQRPAHPARRVGQTPHRSGASSSSPPA